MGFQTPMNLFLSEKTRNAWFRLLPLAWGWGRGNQLSTWAALSPSKDVYEKIGHTSLLDLK